jgi:membrane protein
MSEPADSNHGGPRAPDAPVSRGLADRVGGTIASGTERARNAAEHHASVAIPFRAMERNRGVAASVLAGGVAYRLFLWLLPFGLIVGGVLGLGDAASLEESVASGGLPGAVVDAIGDIARAADSNSWWLLLTGVPLLLWEGYTGARALQLIHSLVWGEPAPRIRPLQSSLAFSGGMCVFVAAVSLTWWIRDWTQLEQLGVLVLMVAPLAGLWLAVSLRLPHGSAGWTALVPGAVLVAIGFQVTHGLVVYLLGPKLETSTSLYGALGAVATILFFMWVVGRIVVTAPILNSALHDEVSARHRDDQAGPVRGGRTETGRAVGSPLPSQVSTQDSGPTEAPRGPIES